ncbi:SagB/ThcOx family dehydrogenase [Chitinispirillales bacterium ANBcel5]|uniref:SagB/ThcOx family dehydrogenase n=1 Tax=Cellulosispirillum alkaliphilum TaxID=3039283 RepID=UPI002A57FFF6|nr:SagB/ThcOx family dehydrogenase [Chitinispirillales bacterium ANBcel5]
MISKKGLSVLVLIVCCVGNPGNQESESISLPDIGLKGSSDIHEVVFDRRSQRSFSEDALTQEHVSDLMWAAGGKTVDGISGATRAYPSAGGLYPLDFFIVVKNVDGLQRDIYRYNWKDHSITPQGLSDRIPDVVASTFSPTLSRSDAAALIVITADFSVTTARYSRRGERRYVPMEAGASAQNVALMAQALGLSSYKIGAFDDKNLSSALNLSTTDPLLIIPIGK